MHLNAVHPRVSGAARRNKVVSAADAVRLIHGGDNIDAEIGRATCRERV